MDLSDKCRAFISLTFALWIITGCASSPTERALKEHPELKPTDGGKSAFDWNAVEGDDFFVFYGELHETPGAGVGIYQGSDPTFRKPRGVTPIKGTVGVFDVDWYPMKDKESKFYRTCLIDYQRAKVPRGTKTVTYVTKRHVWVYADTEDGLERVLAELKKITMFSARPADIVP